MNKQNGNIDWKHLPLSFTFKGYYYFEILPIPLEVKNQISKHPKITDPFEKKFTKRQIFENILGVKMFKHLKKYVTN